MSKKYLHNALVVKKFFGNHCDTTPVKYINVNNINIYIKDESNRLGQRSFKAIAAPYACAKAVSRELTEYGFDNLKNTQLFKNKVFVTASDGNHGTGIAWAASLYGAQAIIYLPKGISNSVVERIKKFGAIAYVTGLCYDDTVKYAAEIAQRQGWYLVQDTTIDCLDTPYVEIPRHIMDCYHLIAHEALEQVSDVTHIILQVGVGTFAGAIIEYAREKLGKNVKIICVEANTVPCLYESLNNGKKTDVVESGNTICKGLDCSKLCDLAWEIFKDNVDHSCLIDNETVIKGIEVLKKSGIKLNFGESGAPVAIGLLSQLTEEQKEEWAINEKSKVLIFNTERRVEE